MVNIGGVEFSAWKLIVGVMLGGYAIVANDMRGDVQQWGREAVEMHKTNERQDAMFVDVQRQLTQQYDVLVIHSAQLAEIQKGVRTIDSGVVNGNDVNDAVLAELRRLRQEVRENKEQQAATQADVRRIYKHLSPQSTR